MELTKYLILSLTIAAVIGLCGCMGSEKERVLENATNKSVTVNASPDVAVNATPDVAVNALPEAAVNAPHEVTVNATPGAAVNATFPAATNTTAVNGQNISQMVQVTRIRDEVKLMNPGTGLFEQDIVFEVKNIWGSDIGGIDVTVLKKECVGEPLIDFGRRSYIFNLTSGEKEEITITFRKFEGYKSGQKFTCPMSIDVWSGTEKAAGDIIYFDVIVP